MSNSSSPNPLLDESESRIIGVLYMVLTLIYAIPYALCLYIMHTEPDLRRSSVYRIMIHMGYSDMIQLLISGILSSLYSLFYSKKFFLLNKLLSGIAEANWFSYLALSQLLAINRVFWVFVREDRLRIWFSMRNTYIYIFICWIPSVIYTVLLALPDVDFVYMVDIGTFGPLESPTIKVLFLINLSIDIIHSILEIFWYSIIYLKVKFQVRNLVNCGKTKADQNILIQAFLLCCADIIVIICWHTMTRLTTKNLLIFKICYIFTNITWFLCAGNNVLVYLLFNTLIREKMKQILCFKSKVSSTLN